MASAPPTSDTHHLQSVAPGMLGTDGVAQPKSKFAAWIFSDHVRLVFIWLALLAVPFVAPNAYVVSLANLALINLI